MTPGRALAVGGMAAAVIAVAWLLFVALPRRYGGASPQTSAASGAEPAMPVRKIKARLFYVSEDGTRLSGVERDVPYGEGPADQAREIIAAQVAPVAEPLVSAVPPGTTLRSLFITDQGEAYVDLSREVSTAHTGGTLDELLTVYTFVIALTANLPAITTVQLLVDGKEVPTLSGHVDLRRPLARDLGWIQ